MAKKKNEVVVLCEELQEKLKWSDTRKKVLCGIIQKLPNNEIASRTKKSRRNIRKHRKFLYEFFDCKDHAKLLDKAKKRLEKIKEDLNN